MYYKVVNSDMSSAYVGSSDRKPMHFAKVIYKEGEWVEPVIEGTYLMVFKSHLDAKTWSWDNMWGTYIYECEVKYPRKTGIFVNTSMHRFRESLVQILNLKKKKSKFMNRCLTPPQGTVFCKSVKLIKRV